MFCGKQCPVCKGKMVIYKDGPGRWFAKCTLCSANIPLENRYYKPKLERGEL